MSFLGHSEGPLRTERDVLICAPMAVYYRQATTTTTADFFVSFRSDWGGVALLPLLVKITLHSVIECGEERFSHSCDAHRDAYSNAGCALMYLGLSIRDINARCNDTLRKVLVTVFHPSIHLLLLSPTLGVGGCWSLTQLWAKTGNISIGSPWNVSNYAIFQSKNYKNAETIFFLDEM